ncbi:flagellin, partial [Azospirillum sp. A39]
GKNLLAGNGMRLDTTSTSRAAVNTIQGIENARVTNVVATDTYSLRVKGDGSIEGNAGDINEAERAHGLTGLKLSGTQSSSLGNFSDVSIEVRGATGRERSFIVGDGAESRTITYFDNTQAIAANTATTAKSGVAQVTNVNVSGTIEEGDIFSITVEGQTFSYTATADDVAIGETASAN